MLSCSIPAGRYKQQSTHHVQLAAGDTAVAVTAQLPTSAVNRPAFTQVASCRQELDGLHRLIVNRLQALFKTGGKCCVLSAQRWDLRSTSRTCSVCKLLTFPSDSGLLRDACLVRIWAELRNEGRFVLCSTLALERHQSGTTTSKSGLHCAECYCSLQFVQRQVCEAWAAS